ncbi:hypothetical protein [Stieleria sp.]|uniref:hypothetical protein n=1 Tax=Stieleria sp. TaxID=2795976 RepID=UPI00356B5C16
MSRADKAVSVALGSGVIGCSVLGLICALILLTHKNTGGSVASSPAIDAQIGTVSVIVGDANEQPPAVMTTEQLADELDVNADTVRRRYADGRLYGFEKLDRDAWVRLGHGACMFRAFDVRDSGLGI